MIQLHGISVSIAEKNENFSLFMQMYFIKKEIKYKYIYTQSLQLR